MELWGRMSMVSSDRPHPWRSGEEFDVWASIILSCAAKVTCRFWTGNPWLNCHSIAWLSDFILIKSDQEYLPWIPSPQYPISLRFLHFHPLGHAHCEQSSSHLYVYVSRNAHYLRLIEANLRSRASAYSSGRDVDYDFAFLWDRNFGFHDFKVMVWICVKGKVILVRFGKIWKDLMLWPDSSDFEAGCRSGEG